MPRRIEEAMAQIALDCPHCRTERAGFHLVSFAQIQQSPQGIATLQCGVCGQGTIAVMNLSTCQAWQHGHQISVSHILSRYPVPQQQSAPTDTPDAVARAFVSGLRNLERSDGSDTNAAVAMFRRALEMAVRQIDPNAPNRGTLIERIERLSHDVIPPAMKLWAHHIRLGATRRCTIRKISRLMRHGRSARLPNYS